jgi:GT2 family glycosyltransferase
MEAVSCVVVSNSRKLTQFLTESSVPFVSEGVNGGFGRSVQAGAATAESWNWLLVVNDDISFDSETFPTAVKNYLGDSTARREIVYFDADMPRSLPRRRDVFMQVSLVGKLLGKLKTPTLTVAESYRSFSCVAISREIYALCNGFDEDLLFTYEDADFVARARQFGVVQRVVTESGVIHAHSLSSGKHVDSVLPVATYSAARYLDKLGGSIQVNSAIILLALLARLIFVPATRAPRSKHLRGIYDAAKAVIKRARMQPHLPEYSKL